MKTRFFPALAAALFLLASCAPDGNIFIEAESFSSCGGWSMDNQSMVQMGSPYLLAHGIGIPVEDAVTSFECPEPGEWHLWVRTRDWTADWGRTEAPGRFEVSVNGSKAGLFGNEGAEWHWQYGGPVSLEKGSNSISLHDLTGFDGRCDAVCFTRDKKEPASRPADPKPVDGGEYDLVVVGGGLSGCAAALAAARYGCKVALVQNRPVLGGNNSSEVRVGPSGLINQEPYPRLGILCDELTGAGHWTNVEALKDTTLLRSKLILNELKQHPEKHQHNAGLASNYDDDRKLELIEAEPLISLFLNAQVVSADKRGSRIRSIVYRDNLTGKTVRLKAAQFADCTGDGNLGAMAGADYRVGRESRAETGEPRAPEVADSLVMGTSVQWYAVHTGAEVSFPECPWAIDFNEQICTPAMRGDWDWEAGIGQDQIERIEHIRDLALRAAYGNWDYMKNRSPRKDEFADARLEWVAYIGGKRESRRLLGDVILNENDLKENKEYEDGSFITTWGTDLHYPKEMDGYDGEAFRSTCKSEHFEPYAVPYRCLYSRNVDNLFMAGRDISATHVALGTIRVMRTGVMMGEVVAMAADICRRSKCDPRGVYTDHLDELKAMMTEGVPTTSPGFERKWDDDDNGPFDIKLR